MQNSVSVLFIVLVFHLCSEFRDFTNGPISPTLSMEGYHVLHLPFISTIRWLFLLGAQCLNSKLPTLLLKLNFITFLASFLFSLLDFIQFFILYLRTDDTSGVIDLPSIAGIFNGSWVVSLGLMCTFDFFNLPFGFSISLSFLIWSTLELMYDFTFKSSIALLVYSVSFLMSLIVWRFCFIESSCPRTDSALSVFVNRLGTLINQ